MREDFEKLPHILELMQYVVCFDGLKYVSENQRTADYLNGAYYAFQEQQKKIDKIIESVNGFKLAASSFDTEYNEGGYMVCTLMLNDIENILK